MKIITGVRVPAAMTDHYKKRIGQMAKLTGNAYQGMFLLFSDTEKIPSDYFYYTDRPE